MSPKTSMFRRVWSAFPIVFAMLFHAIALDRWLLVIPAMTALIVILFRPSSLMRSSRQWYAVFIVGVVVGLVVPAADVTTGPLPPAAAATLTGVAVAIALFAMRTDQWTIAWAASWALVTISGKTEMVAPLRVVLLGFLLSSLVAAAFHARLLGHRDGSRARWEIRGIGMHAFVMILIGLSTAGIASALHRVDRLFINSVENFVGSSSPSGTTGLGNSLSLSSKRTITPSMEPLLELSEQPGLLRVKVMDEFDGAQWRTSSKLIGQSIDLDGPESTMSNPRELEVLFLQEMDNAIPSPAGTYAVQNASARVEGGWTLRGKLDGVSVILSGDRSEQLPPEPIVGGEYRAVPEELQNRIAPEAKNLTSGLTSNEEKAHAIATYFQQNFEYSLSTDLSGEDHPLVTLIEQRRPAYCVYFASAMAVMLRTQGVPTRVVTGYVPGEVNPLTGRVIVRSRDAHAWVEVWSPETNRFMTFDPTPSTSRRAVMGHDQPIGYLPAAVGAVRSAIERTWLLLKHQPLTGVLALVASPWLWFVVATVFLVIFRRRRRTSLTRIHSESTEIDPKLIEMYEQYLRSLRSAGVVPQPSETDEEILARLADVGHPRLFRAANRFVERYRSVRFAAKSVVGEDEELRWEFGE